MYKALRLAGQLVWYVQGALIGGSDGLICIRCSNGKSRRFDIYKVLQWRRRLGSGIPAKNSKLVLSYMKNELNNKGEIWLMRL